MKKKFLICDEKDYIIRFCRKTPFPPKKVIPKMVFRDFQRKYR